MGYRNESAEAVRSNTYANIDILRIFAINDGADGCGVQRECAQTHTGMGIGT